MTGAPILDPGGDAAAMPVVIGADEAEQLGLLFTALARWVCDSAPAALAGLLGYCIVAGAVPAGSDTQDVHDLIDPWASRFARRWLLR